MALTGVLICHSFVSGLHDHLTRGGGISVLYYIIMVQANTLALYSDIPHLTDTYDYTIPCNIV